MDTLAAALLLLGRALFVGLIIGVPLAALFWFIVTSNDE